jgi:hypothetical protein
MPWSTTGMEVRATGDAHPQKMPLGLLKARAAGESRVAGRRCVSTGPLYPQIEMQWLHLQPM